VFCGYLQAGIVLFLLSVIAFSLTLSKPYLDPDDQVVEEISAWCNVLTIVFVLLLPVAADSGRSDFEQSVSWGIIVTQAVSLLNQIQYNLKPLFLALYAAVCAAKEEEKEEEEEGEKEGLEEELVKAPVEEPVPGPEHKVDMVPQLVPVEKLSEVASTLQAWFWKMREGQVPGDDPEHARAMDDAFAVMDTDGSGTLDPIEVQDLLEMLGDTPLSADEVDALILAADSDGDGSVDLEEFRLLTRDVFVTLNGDTLEGVSRKCGIEPAMLVQVNSRYGGPDAAVWRPNGRFPAGMALRVRVVPVSEDVDRASMFIQSWWASMRRGVFEHRDKNRLGRAFAALDMDGSGSVDSNELHDVLGLLGDNPLEEEEIAALLKAGDANGDGSVDVDEFLALAEAGYVCLATDTLRRVADVCHCNPKLLARHNGIDETAMDERLPSGFVVKITASSRRVDMAGTTGMTSPVVSPDASPSDVLPESTLEAVRNIDEAVDVVHDWWRSMRQGQRPQAPPGLAESLAPLDQSGLGQLDRENLRDVLTLLGEEPLGDDSADALVAALFTEQSQVLPVSALVDLMANESAFVTLEGESMQDAAGCSGSDPVRLARANGYRPAQILAGCLDEALPAGTLLALPPPRASTTLAMHRVQAR